MQEIDDPWRHRQPPDNEVPGSIAFEAVLASSADLAVFMSGISVFRHGIEFTVEVRVRPDRTRSPLVDRSKAQPDLREPLADQQRHRQRRHLTA